MTGIIYERIALGILLGMMGIFITSLVGLMTVVIDTQNINASTTSPMEYTEETYLPTNQTDLEQGLAAFLLTSNELRQNPTQEQMEEWVRQNIEWSAPWDYSRYDEYSERLVTTVPIIAKGDGNLLGNEILLVDAQVDIFLESKWSGHPKVFFIWPLTMENRIAYIDLGADPVLKVRIGEESYVSSIDQDAPDKDIQTSQFIELTNSRRSP